MPLSPQETLEDLDKNKDGYIQVDEYIGEWDPRPSLRRLCPPSPAGSPINALSPVREQRQGRCLSSFRRQTFVERLLCASPRPQQIFIKCLLWARPRKHLWNTLCMPDQGTHYQAPTVGQDQDTLGEDAAETVTQ